MGGCFGSQPDQSPSNTDSSDGGTVQQGVSIGKNQPLRHEKLKWKSDVPLTEGQLRSKRDEFWDTAPAFEGRKEIWDALKAASYAAEISDYTLAQAIVDGASISLPNGTLTDCYDELGNRYQLPVYCLSSAINMIEEDSQVNSDGICENGNASTSSCGGAEVFIKIRLSLSSRDVKLAVKTLDTIAAAKSRLQTLENVDPANQRWFFGGRLLHDKMTVDEAKIPAGFVVQVIVTPSDSEVLPSVES